MFLKSVCRQFYLAFNGLKMVEKPLPFACYFSFWIFVLVFPKQFFLFEWIFCIFQANLVICFLHVFLIYFLITYIDFVQLILFNLFFMHASSYSESSKYAKVRQFWSSLVTSVDWKRFYLIFNLWFFFYNSLDRWIIFLALVFFTSFFYIFFQLVKKK